MNMKKAPRGSNWSESQLFTQFDTGIYKIPCQIIYIPSCFIMPNNEMFLLITDGRQIYSVIQLFWNKPCPTLQADLLLCLWGSVKSLYSGIFLPPPQFSRTKMYLTCLTFHTSFLNLAVTTFFPGELWLALSPWGGREDHFLLHSWESCSLRDKKGEGSQANPPKDAPNTALSSTEGLKQCIFILLARWTCTNFLGQWERALH